MAGSLRGEDEMEGNLTRDEAELLDIDEQIQVHRIVFTSVSKGVSLCQPIPYTVAVYINCSHGCEASLMQASEC